MQSPIQDPSAYRVNQRPAEDPGAQARFEADLALLQQARGWKSFLYSKSDPAARKRFYLTVTLMVGLAGFGLRMCAQMQRQENQRVLLHNLQTEQHNRDLLLGR